MNKRYTQKALVVDNNQEELDQLYEVLDNIGFHVKTHLYDQSVDVDYLFEGYRIVFFDLNITPISIDPDTKDNLDWKSNSNLSEVFGALAQALRDVISSENGPYALILWTKHKELVSSFKDYIFNRHKNNEFPHPFFISYLDKIDFNGDDSEYKFIDALFENTILKSLMNFESIINQQSHNLVSEIINLASKDTMEAWKDDQIIKRNFISFLQKMAVQSAGYSIAKVNPSRALSEAITPILKYKIEKYSDSSKVWDEIIDLSTIPEKEVKFPEGFDIAKLNNFFHIDSSPEYFSTRGAVFVLKKESNEGSYFFKDKFNIKKSSTFIENTIRGLDKENRSRVNYIAIEISAACDYSQDKPRLNKYILGLKIPSEFYDLYKEKITTENINLSNATLDFPFRFKDIISNEDFNVVLNLNYVCTLNSNEKVMFDHLFTFKKEMIDYIGNNYANHVSRIGITSY